jgi:nucleoside-diphosphate-sugar epimerase
MNKVLIIGSNGYIGSRLCERLWSTNFDVVGIDNFRRPDTNISNDQYNIKMSYQKYSNNEDDDVKIEIEEVEP